MVGKIILTEKLAKIISEILLKHSSQVESFKLDFLYTRKEAAPYLNEWIKILKEKGVKYLSIEMDKGHHCSINDQIFYCDKLQVLKIRLCNFLPPLSYNNFVHLKDLHLDEVQMDKSEFTELISKCPALEKLTIINMFMHPFEVSGNPNLKYLHIQGGKFTELHLENVESVKFFLLHLSLEMKRVQQSSTSNLTSIFSKLTGTEKLEIWSFSMQLLAIGEVPTVLPFMLDTLKDMFLVMDVIDLTHTAVALSLMRSSPNLEKLRIGDWWERPVYNRDAAVKFWAKHCKENITYKHLKFVIVENYRGVHSEVNFIRYICRHSPSLKRIVLKVDWDVVREDLIQDLRPWPAKLTILRVSDTVDFIKGLSREGIINICHCA